MKAVVKIDVPEWQIGQDVSIYFPDTMLKRGKCEAEKQGHWIVSEPNEYTRIVKCSECGGPAPFVYVSDDYYGGRGHGEDEKTKFCPNCGAEMLE